MTIPQTFDEAFTRVKELVAIFEENESFYTSMAYNEADARKDFIDKLWIALGWDVNHEQQTDPYKQEVKVERGVATSEFRKRADYAFLAPNFRDVRFYVEAKKQLASARTERDQTFYESKCATLHRQIDNLVYELYDLTPEEIAIVEGQTK
jgi:type I site-specific restriction endonuclease